MSTLKLGQRIRVFEVVSSNYSADTFKIGGHYAEHPDSVYSGSHYGAELVNDSPTTSKLPLPINDGTFTYLKQVGTLVIKKIK